MESTSVVINDADRQYGKEMLREYRQYVQCERVLWSGKDGKKV